MEEAVPYDHVRGVFYDDEWAWVMGYRNPYQGSQGLGSYSPWANERFEKITGLETPLPVYREPGYVAPENDPWLKWCEVIRQDAYYDYNEAMKDLVKGHRDDFVMCNYPGGFEGNLDIIIEEIYLDCWKESPLEAFERIDVRANFREDQARDQYPVWSLIGIFRMPEDKSMYPETLRLTAGACLGRGTKGMILWNSVNLWAPYLQHPMRDSLDAEAKRLGAHIKTFGPMYLNLKKKASDVWMLSGWFWVNSFDNYLHIPIPEEQEQDMERPWWMFQVSDIATPASIRAGLDVEFVTEKQLMSDELLSRKAVVLPSLQYCRQGVIDNLQRYIKQGGKVYVDESTAVEIPGAEVLPVDFAKWHHDIANGKRPVAQPTEATYRRHKAMREGYVNEAIGVFQDKIGKHVDSPVSLDDPQGAYSILYNGSTRYVFVYNTDVDRARLFNVTLNEPAGAVYNLRAGHREFTPATDGKIRVQTTLPAGGWNVYVCADNVLDELDVVRNGTTLRIQALTDDKTPFDAAVPLRITLQGSNGETFSYTTATDRGTTEVDIPVEELSFTPERIMIQELLSGHNVQLAM